MCTLYRTLSKSHLNLLNFCRQYSKIDNLLVKNEVRVALHEGMPVVALESTIITHGMPYPQNIKCALEVEAVVRSQGAVPATLAIIEGQIKVGLDENELEQLGETSRSRPIKTSRRDLPYVISNRLNGGTTVAGTLIIAKMIGIPIFATGGIGGVHRAGNITFDVSADLNELGRSNVAVVSSGVKSILDIPKTLEYLETQGVFVAAFGNGNDFPSFYTRKSGSFAPYSVQTARQAAEIIHCSRNLDLDSGMLFAVPVPEKFALDEGIINSVIEEALKDAERDRIGGKEITPFLLKRIGEISGGKSLETNVALIKNNARVAASIAVELSNCIAGKHTIYHKEEDKRPGNPVVIGGSNLDCSIKLEEAEIKLDGRIHFGKSVMTGGGVARNIYEALSKLGANPTFVSVLGDDPQGTILKGSIPKGNVNRVKVIKGQSTGQCTVVFDSSGECKFLAGDMRIHGEITPEMIRENEDLIKSAPLVIFDANLSIPTIDTILSLADRYNVPAFFEPTDVEISVKPFKSIFSKAIKLITPNLEELKHIASYLKIGQNKNYTTKVEEAVDLAAVLTNYVANVIVTLGCDGIVIARRGEASTPLFGPKENEKLQVRHYPTTKICDVVNVSGAGDCLASGIVAGILKGLSEEECVSMGFAAAHTSLLSLASVPERFIIANEDKRNDKVSYRTFM